MTVILVGENLGKKHQNYNKLLKETIKNNKNEDLSPIDYGDSDINNFLKIDVACYNRNVNYILEVLKSEDILYASRVIKKSTWLYTDDQYTNIINPEYLNSTLLPSMTTKAFNKLQFEIRTKLTNKKRIEEFYNYYKDKNYNAASKWLPRCSIPFIEQEVESKCNNMKLELLENLCKLSFNILEICVKNLKCILFHETPFKGNKERLMEKNTQYMKEDLKRFLDMAESTKDELPRFGPKQTKILMRDPDRILNNLIRYQNRIDLDTFAKEMDPKTIKDFLKGLSNDKTLKELLLNDTTVKPFIMKMPKAGRFEFVKEFFINKSKVSDDEDDAMLYDCSTSDFSDIYRWYVFAPFEIAFPDLTKLIRAESSVTERLNMFNILLNCAKNSKHHIKTLLSYFLNKHINEPTKYKTKFINTVISKTSVHKYDEDTWKILNEIFYSLELYNVNHTEPNVDINSCVRVIILYNLLHNISIPEAIEKKFVFNTFITYESKLTKNEKEVIFEYLICNLKSKIEVATIKSEIQFSDTFHNLERLFQLINDWRKNVSDYPFALDTVRKLIEVKKKNSWEFNMSALYKVNKSWRKYMFEESFDLLPSEEVCYNALKHKPELLSRYKEEVQKCIQRDNIVLGKVLKKIRTYWSQTLAEEWSSVYLAKLKEKNDPEHKSFVKGLFILLPHKHILDVVKEYAPNENKVNWSEVDEFELTLRKLIAKNMYLSRPMVPPQSILWYAKGDYLKFVLPSFYAIFDNLCQNKMQEYIPELLRAPVSLQKHGIRLLSHKQQSKETYSKLKEIWKIVTNKTIRTTIFKQVLKLIYSENDPILLEEAWKTLSSFIDDLTPEENKIIYTSLGNVSEVPRPLRARYCMKCYKFLKSLPAKNNCDEIKREVINSTVAIMEDFDLEFISEILIDDFDKKIKTYYDHKSVISRFLLTCKTEKIQSQRYEVFLRLMNKIFELWNEKDGNQLRVRENFHNILNALCNDYVRHVCALKMNSPVLLFENILNKIESNLPFEENYFLLRKWKFVTAFARAVDTQVSKFLLYETEENALNDYYWVDSGNFDHIFLETNKLFAKDIVEYLKADIQKFPSALFLFERVYSDLINNIAIACHIGYDILQNILELTADFIPGQLFVLDSIPYYFGYSDPATTAKEIIIRELRLKFKNHPSAEVKTYYYLKFPFNPDPVF